MIELQYSNFYKEMFESKTCHEDIKSMKRFIRRKIEFDNLNKKKTVPKRQWARAIYQSSISTDDYGEDLLKLSSMVNQPKMIHDPLKNNNTKALAKILKRSRSCKKLKMHSKTRKIIYNSEIVVFQENSSDSESIKSSSGSFSDKMSDSFSNNKSKKSSKVMSESFSGDDDTKYEIYNESNVDALSSKSSDKEKEEEVDEQETKKIKRMQSKSFERKKSIAIKNFNDDNEDENEYEEEKGLVLNGDYILRKALLKDQDIQELSSKEMKHCLLKCCKVHVGKDELGQKILEIYRRPDIREITEEEVNTIVIQFLREIRKCKESKRILDLLDDIQNQIVKTCPFGSMMKILYKLEDENSKNKDIWFIPNREDTH